MSGAVARARAGMGKDEGMDGGGMQAGTERDEQQKGGDLGTDRQLSWRDTGARGRKAVDEVGRVGG